MSGVWSLLVTDPDSNYSSCLLKSLLGRPSLLSGPRLEEQDIEKDKRHNEENVCLGPSHA